MTTSCDLNLTIKRLINGLSIGLLLSCVLASFISSLAFAQDAAPFSTLKRVSTEEGLSQSTVISFEQDNLGFMWIGTSEGLNTYDGYDARVFLGKNKELLASYIDVIHQDEAGIFWISVFQQGLFRYDPISEELSLVMSAGDEPDLDIIAFHDDNQETLLLASSKELFLLNKATNEYRSLVSFKEVFDDQTNIRALAVLGSQVFAGTSTGLYVIDANSGAWRAIAMDGQVSDDYELQTRIYDLRLDTKQRLWIGTAKGIYLMDARDKSATLSEPQRIVKQGRIRDLLVTNNYVYAATGNGLLRLDLDGGNPQLVAQFTRSNFQIDSNRINKLYEDRSGNIWLASNSRGAYIWNPRSFSFTQTHASQLDGKALSNNLVWTIEETTDGYLWVGTDNGLNKLNLATGENQIFFKSGDEVADESVIVKVKSGNDGMLWMATFAGLRKFNPATGELVTIELQNPEFQSVLDIPELYFDIDEFGTLWINTPEGFYRYYPQSGEIVELSSVKASVNSYYAIGFLGRIPGTNLNSLTASGQFWGVDMDTLEPQLLYELEDYSQQALTYVDNWLQDPKTGLIWTSFTDEGLVALEPETYNKVKQVSTMGGKSIGPVYGAMLDNKRRIWFSSHDGLFAYNIDSADLIKFDESYGFTTTEYNSGAFLSGSNGKYYYGSVGGLTEFDPSTIVASTFGQLHTTITDFTVANNSQKSVWGSLADKQFSVDYDEVGIAISFSTLSYAKQDSTLFHYELTGAENIQFPPTNDNVVRFSQLAPGEYQFSVYAISPIDGRRSNTATLSISVAYAPWSSPIALFLYALSAFAFTVLWVYRRRIKQQVLIEMNEDLRESEGRLRLALQSSHSHAWEWNEDTRVISLARSDNDLGRVNEATFKEHYQQIHQDDRRDFLKEWQTLFDESHNDAFNFTYRMMLEDETEWRWVRSVGQIVSRNENGYPTRITGLLTDITTMRNVEESALIFGEAFRNTKDWVVIIDSDFNGVMANSSFYEAFAIPENQPFSLRDKVFRGLNEKMVFYREIMLKMQVGEHWHGQDSLLMGDDSIHHILINISLVTTRRDKSNQFVIIFTDISAQKTAEEELRILANFDSLTGLPNRSLLIDRIEHAIQVAERGKNIIAVLFIDLDRFKPVNDSLGHDYGDLLLQKIAERLQQRVRKQDTVARLGGDEFVVLLEDFNMASAVGEVARDLSEHISLPVELGEHTVSVTSSIGIATFPGDASTPADLLRDADIAMYHAKKDTQTTYHFYTESMDREVREKLQRETDLKQALMNQEFVNFYQPIVNSETNRICGAELLLRWESKHGLVPPDEFIPLSEQLGLIIPMTNDALRRGLEDVKKWRKTDPDFYVSLNLSVLHFELDDLSCELEKALNIANLPANALRVEVTESALITHPEKAINTMEQFKKLGIELALDDFGTGYSSLAYLKQLPLGILKIDRSFISGIGQDDRDQAIVNAILGVAKSLGLLCVAEGVETQKHIDYLNNLECEYLQGYFYSKPVPEKEFTNLLEDTNLSQ